MAFVKKFNVLPIAIGLILALSFAPFIDAVVALIFNIIGLIAGNEMPAAFLDTLMIGDLLVGPVISTFISFLIVAFVVFMIVKALKKSGLDTEAAETPDQKLLAEIRDALKK